MGAHDAGNQHQFTGIAKYFNSYTITGRRNVSCVYINCIVVKRYHTFMYFSQLLYINAYYFYFQCVLATYATIAAIALFYKLKPKKKPAVTEQ